MTYTKNISILSVVGSACIALCSLAAVQTANEADQLGDNLINLSKIGTALRLYMSDYDEVFPVMSSPDTESPRTRWADKLAPYSREDAIFAAVGVGEDLLTRKLAHNNKPWGGYGYNYQYLGNSRFPWAAKLSEIGSVLDTVAFADTDGVLAKDKTRSGVYVVDPPHPSKRGSARPTGYYANAEACGEGPEGCRSKPASRFGGKTCVLFVDGHLDLVLPALLDDFDKDGTKDNGWFNGSADPKKR